jgi:N-acetylneuraminate lyase
MQPMKTPLLQGVVPALITPFDPKDYSVNLQAIPVLLKHFLEAGVGGFFINGTSAEFKTLTVEERKTIAEKVISEVANQIPVVVHVGATNLAQAIDLAKHAKSINAQAIGTLPPLDREHATLDTDVAWYKAVGEATDLPLYVYWRSDMAKGSVRPRTFLEKMQSVPNFAGIKFGDPDLHVLQSMRWMSNNTLNCVSGPDELFLAGLVLDSHGAIGTTYNIMPRHFVSLYNDFKNGDIVAAQRKQREAGELIEALVENGIVFAGTKAIMQQQGLPAGPCRPISNYGATVAAHTETKFTDHVTDEQLKTLMDIVHKYNLS